MAPGLASLRQAVMSGAPDPCRGHRGVLGAPLQPLPTKRSQKSALGRGKEELQAPPLAEQRQRPATGKRREVGSDSALSISLSRIPGPEPLRPSLPHLYPTDPHSTPLCTAAHRKAPRLTSHSAPFLGHARLQKLRLQTHPAPPQEETPVLVQACRGAPGSPGWGLERRGRRTKPPFAPPPTRPWGGGPGSAQPCPHPSPHGRGSVGQPLQRRRRDLQPKGALGWGRGAATPRATPQGGRWGGHSAPPPRSLSHTRARP